jgi:hypothetical protein
MKSRILPTLAGLVCCCLFFFARAQEFKEHISKEFELSKAAGAGTTFSVYNISGFIKVQGYEGTKVLVEIDKTISADDAQWLEIGKKEFKLGLEQTGDSITAYIAEPYDSRPHYNRYQRDNGREVRYDYRLDFTVKVPYGVSLNISTVNDGDISVKDVSGDLYVNNVNGAISVVNAKGTTYAHTVNGDVVLSYLSAPSGQSSYYTINGEIRVTYPSSLSADLQFKSMNGEFFTDFPNAEVLPVQATKNKETHGGATVYRLDKTTSVRVGSGGKTFKFETLNGNIYIKKQS